MGLLSFFDAIRNVCRTWLDVFHILIYVAIALVFVIYALYKVNKSLYQELVYKPIKYAVIRVFLVILEGADFLLTKYINYKKKKAQLKSNRKIYRNKKK